jgi:hypothetical protein
MKSIICLVVGLCDVLLLLLPENKGEFGGGFSLAEKLKH